MNPNLIYKKINALFPFGIVYSEISMGSEGFGAPTFRQLPLRFGADPSDLPEDTPYIVCAVSLQAMPDLETNHTAEATIEFSIVIPILENTDWAYVETAFDEILSTLYVDMRSDKLNILAPNVPVRFYSVHPDNVPVLEHDEFRITKSITFKASVQF